MAKKRSVTVTTPEAVTKEVLYAGRFIGIARLGKWEFAERLGAFGAVIIVATTAEGNLLLIEQFRPPVGQRVIELPAGLVGDIPGETDWSEAARRELLEETGYKSRRVTELAHGPISAGFSNETLRFFRATGLTRENAGGGVDGENIQTHEVPLARVPAWLKKQVKAGKAVDPKVFAGLYFANR